MSENYSNKPLLLPSLKKSQVKVTGPGSEDIVAPNLPITDADEKAFERHIGDYDIKAQDVINNFSVAKRGNIEQAISPTSLLNFITDEPHYKSVMVEMRRDFVKDTGSTGTDLRDKLTENERKAQIEAIMKQYDKVGKLQKLNYYMDNDVAIKRKISKDDLNLIISKERFQYWSPDKIASQILDDVKMPFTADEKSILEEVKDNMERDRVAREHGYLSEEAFIGRIANYNKLLLDGPLRGDRARFNTLERDFKRKAFIDFNILNDQIKRINAITTTAPGSKVSIALNRIVDNMINDLRNGKIDLNQAFDRINGANKMLKATPAETLSQRLTTIPKEVQQIKTTKTLGEDKYFEELRKNSLVAFKGIGFDETRFDPDAVIQVADGAYAIVPKSKDTIQSNIQRVLTSNYPGPKGPINLDIDLNDPSFVKVFTKDRIGDIFVILNKNLSGYGVYVDPNKYPSFGQAINKKKMTGTRSEIVKEFGDIYNNLVEMDSFLKATGKIPQPTIASLEFLRDFKIPITGTETREPKSKSGISLTQKMVEMRPSSEFKDQGGTPADIEENKRKREKKYSHENLKYTKGFTKEIKEELSAQYGPNIYEYDIKTEDQLLRMKQTVSKLDGQLYVIDLKTGRLYPIELDKTFIGQTYIFMKEPKTGGSFAEFPVLHKIYRDEEKLMPYKHLQFGRDKRQFRIHQVPRNEYGIDYRDQIRNEIGAGFWKSIRNGVKSAFMAPIHGASYVGNYVVGKTVSAAKDLAKDSVYEGKNFVNQERKNIKNIAQANKKFYKNPSLKNFINAYGQTTSGIGKLALQPAITGTRELSNVSDFAGKVPGLNVVKFGAEYAIPGLAVADALSHATKNLNIGTDEKPRYLDAAINTLDAITGSGQLSGSIQNGARVLQGGLQLTDRLTENH